MTPDSIRTRLASLAGVLLAGSTAVALASGDHAGGHGNEEETDGHGHGTIDFDFGSEAPRSEADRTIEIVARDDMTFEPEMVQVEPGETVRFVVRNAGELQHSFTLGSRKYHRRHDREMQSMPADEITHHMADSSNGLVVQPGETASLTWRFDHEVPIRFACHIPGHYPAGMWGEIGVPSESVAALPREWQED